MNRKNIMALIAVTFSASSQQVAAQDTGAMGAVLEAKFRLLADTCFGAKTYRPEFFPHDIATHPKANEASYMHLQGVSFEGLSTVLFSENGDLHEALTPAGNQIVTLKAEDQSISTNSYFNSLKYSFSCTSALKMAVDAGVDPTPINPWKAINVSAGLKAEASNAADSGLTIVYGRLQSPLSLLANEQHDVYRRMRGQSALWLTTSANSKVKSYLDFLEGWLVASTTAQDSERALKVNSTASVHALVLNADWSSNADVKYTSTFSSAKFDVYIMPSPPGAKTKYPFAYSLYATPTAATLSAELKGAASINPPSGAAAEAIGHEAKYAVSIAGIDSALCNGASEWQASMPSPDHVKGTVSSYDDRNKTCLLTINTSVQDAADERETSLTIENVGHKIDGKSVQSDFRVRYRTAAYPAIRAIDAKVEARGEPDIRLSIDMPLELRPIPGTSMTNVYVMPNTRLQCGDGSASTAQSTYTTDPKPHVHTEFSFPDRKSFPNGRCALTASLQIDDEAITKKVYEVSFETSITPALLPALVVH